MITDDDLAGAAPLVPVPRANFRYVPPPPPPPGRSRLAIAALITAIAGIPLVGVITGLVAILLAALALGSIHHTRQKGTVLAVVAMGLGMVDVVGWIIFLVIVLEGGVSTGALPIGEDELPGVASTSGYAPKIRRAIEANVVVERKGSWLGRATGSGVVLSIHEGEALIVTNRHVIDANYPSTTGPVDLDKLNKVPLEIKLYNQPARLARVTWIAPGGVDLGLVSVPCSSTEVQAALWGRAHAIQVGDAAFAIGNPLGLEWTYTGGSISQFRTMQFGGRQVRLIQTSVPINFGNSGGGLYDDHGYLIGINTLTKDKRISEGLSFAIALDSLLELAPPGLGDGPETPGKKAPPAENAEAAKR